MDITHKFFAIIGEVTKKCGIVAIKTVETYPFEPDPIFPCQKDHLKRLFMLGLEDDLVCRNFSFLTALPVLDPFLRQIEPKIYR
jgi:hypothetical protein